MATFALGDVQGCMEPLSRLLRVIDFTPGRDRLWLVGDLVNRGPDSLGVLRWVTAHAGSVTTVLGNHDLHLLAVAAGVRDSKRGDTLDDVLRADDRRRLLDWLAAQPLVHREGDLLLAHAGVHPAWSAEEALTLGREASDALRSQRQATLAALYAQPAEPMWTPELLGADRLRTVVASLTRMRMVTRAGALEFSYAGTPEEAPSGLVPWFEVTERRAQDTTIVCGHWAALGLRLMPRVLALDTGCVWGRKLTAVRLEDRVVFQVDARAE